MDKLTEHYGQLLGLDEFWEASEVDLDLEGNRVEIRLTHRGQTPVACPGRQAACSIADHAPERSWRHLDTMQFETVLRAAVPRANCPQCGVKTVLVPWADKHSRFTLLFESFAVRVLEAANNVKRAAALLGLDWDGAHRIMERAVERGLGRRQLDEVRHVGMDEKCFRRGHDYLSLLTDLSGARVPEVSEGRDQAGADRLWQALSTEQAAQIEAAAVDMWPAYAAAVATHAPQAEIVHDRFHVSKHLNEAVDQVRRGEHKSLKKSGDDRLTGSKQLWLFNPENLREDQWLKFEPLKDQELKTSRAWAIKEQFRRFWEYRNVGNAQKCFARWYGWAVRSRLPRVVKVAKTLKRHLPNLLTYFRHPITNAMSEGFNGKIQDLKSAARGFRAFANFRTRLNFHCGKLELSPVKNTH